MLNFDMKLRIFLHVLCARTAWRGTAQGSLGSFLHCPPGCVLEKPETDCRGMRLEWQRAAACQARREMLPQLQGATARRSYHRRSELISGDWANSLSRSSTTGNLFLYNRARPLGARSCRRRSHCRGGVLLTTHGDWLAEAIHLRYRLRNMRFSPKRWTRTQVYEGNSGRTEWGNTTIGGRQRAQRTAIRNLNGTGPEAGPPPTMPGPARARSEAAPRGRWRTPRVLDRRGRRAPSRSSTATGKPLRTQGICVSSMGYPGPASLACEQGPHGDPARLVDSRWEVQGMSILPRGAR